MKTVECMKYVTLKEASLNPVFCISDLRHFHTGLRNGESSQDFHLLLLQITAVSYYSY